MPLPCVHVTATDPLCAGRHSDLVAHAIVADRRARGVRAVKEIVARERRIISARIADAIMDRVVPVVIVIGVLTVPTAVMRLEGVMRPANTGIRARYNNVLSGKAQRPYLGRVRVTDARLDCRRPLERRRRLARSLWLRKMILDEWISFNARYVWPSCQCFGDLSCSLSLRLR